MYLILVEINIFHNITLILCYSNVGRLDIIYNWHAITPGVLIFNICFLCVCDIVKGVIDKIYM